MTNSIPLRLLYVGLLHHVTCSKVASNELLGWPIIHCNEETIEMVFETKNEFQGKVYVRGNYNRPECRVEYSSKSIRGNSTRGIRIDHGACNMSRQRLVPPDGMVLSTVLVISFHPLFITKSDKMFSVRCMYREASRSIGAKLDVSMLPSEQIPVESPSPTCSYTIRRDSLDGDILAYAKVGDQVVHRWNCDTEVFGILVHSCTVEDGQGQKQTIVDEYGCHTDRLLLGDPTYVADLNLAYREGSIFKFADRSSVRFRCEIRLCLKFDAGCEGITPPLCNRSTRDSRSYQELNYHNHTRSVDKRSTIALGGSDADLFSQTVVVLDEDFDDPQQTSEARIFSSQPLCLPYHIVMWIGASVSAGIVISLTVAAIQCRAATCA